MHKSEINIICSPDILIKIVEPTDVNADYLDTLLDYESTKYMAEMDKATYSISSIKEYVKNQLDSSESLLFGLYKNSYLIATSRIHEIDKSNAWQGVLVFKRYQKLGFGLVLVKTISDFVIKNFNLASLSAGVHNDNIASQQLFNKAGFEYKYNDKLFLEKQIWVRENV